MTACPPNLVAVPIQIVPNSSQSGSNSSSNHSHSDTPLNCSLIASGVCHLLASSQAIAKRSRSPTCKLSSKLRGCCSITVVAGTTAPIPPTEPECPCCLASARSQCPTYSHQCRLTATIRPRSVINQARFGIRSNNFCDRTVAVVTKSCCGFTFIRS